MAAASASRPQTATGSSLVAALEQAWAAIRARHPEVPEVVLVVASGSGPRGGVEKWGHFAGARWELGDQGERSEVLIGGEGLRRGAAEVLETLLHEAAHGLAHVREIEDTSRQGRYHNRRYRGLAEQLGLRVEQMQPFGWTRTELKEETRLAYALVIEELALALVLWRREEAAGAGGRAKSRNLLACECSCGRKIRVAPATLEQGPIVCGVCEEEFAA
jgi:hypothetical protein